MTTRSVGASLGGAVPLSLDLPAGRITVIADPDCLFAEVTVTARGEDPAVHSAVRDAVMRWDDRVLTVTVSPAAGSGGVFGSGITINGGVAFSGSNIVAGDVVINGVSVSGSAGFGCGQIEVTARVPEGSSVSARTRSASLNATGELADVNFNSVSGDLQVGGTGVLRARTTSGDVTATAVDGTTEVRTVSGDIHLGRVDAVSAESVSGDVRVADFAGHAALTTVSGDIAVHAAEGGTVTARSVSGDVTVTATGTALAEDLTVHATSRSGDVSTPGSTPPTMTRARRPRRSTGGA